MTSLRMMARRREFIRRDRRLEIAYLTAMRCLRLMRAGGFCVRNWRAGALRLETIFCASADGVGPDAVTPRKKLSTTCGKTSAYSKRGRFGGCKSYWTRR